MTTEEKKSFEIDDEIESEDDEEVESEEDEKVEAEEEKQTGNATKPFLENEFKGALKHILNHLKDRADADSLFKVKLESSTQTAKKLMEYLSSEAKKAAVGNVAIISDECVFSWAVHFIDENIQDVKAEPAKIQVSSTSEKTEEKKKAKPIILDNKPNLFDFAEE